MLLFKLVTLFKILFDIINIPYLRYVQGAFETPVILFSIILLLVGLRNKVNESTEEARSDSL